MATTTRPTDKQVAADHLRNLCPAGTRIYTLQIRHTDRGARYHRVYVVIAGAIRDITGYVGQVAGLRWSERHYAVGGNFTGGDDVVRALSYALHGDERALRHEAL